MYGDSGCASDVYIKRLRDRASIARSRVDETTKSKKRQNEILDEIEKRLEQLGVFQTVYNYLNKSNKVYKKYLDKKESTVIAGIQGAIHSAKRVIPETADLELEVDKQSSSARIIDSHDCYANDVVGSACKATIGLFAKSVVLDNTEYFKFMMLDEQLANLSPDSSYRISTYINVLSKRFQMVVIEHKDQVFDNNEGVDFIFTQENGITNIERRERTL